MVDYVFSIIDKENIFYVDYTIPIYNYPTQTKIRKSRKYIQMAITNKILIAFVFTILCVTSDVHCNTYASPPTHCAPSASPSGNNLLYYPYLLNMYIIYPLYMNIYVVLMIITIIYVVK